jgi:hypothetical protein
VDAGLGAASVLANLHHRRIIPLMERGLRIFKMEETANPVVLARSRLVHDRLPPEYAATRARCAINLKAVKNSNDDLWSFVMLADGLLVSGLFPPFLYSSARCRRDSDVLSFPAEGGRERSTVRPAHTPSPSARAQRSGRNRSGRRVRRSGESGGGNARSKGTKNSGCASSRDFPRRPWRIRRREMKRRRRVIVGRPP